MNLTLESTLSLVDLEIRQDKKHYIVEDNHTGEFYEMPKVCIDAIELIKNGKGLAEIEQTLKTNYPNEDVEIIPFVEQLVEFGLVKEIDGKIVTTSQKNKSPNAFNWISANFASFFFNKISNKIYLFLLFINIGLILLHPELLPHYQDIFIFDSMIANMLTYTGISLILILIHEFGHILAIRSYNLPTKLDIGNRLFLIVFETDLTPAWKLAPRQRNPLYFAGMSFEQVILFIAFSLTLLIGDSNPLLFGLLGIIIFDIFVKTIYQFSFFMKTDIYFIIENITGSYNLMESGKNYLSKWLPFIKQDTTTTIYKDELSAVRLYSVFYVIGMVLITCLFALYFLPQMIAIFAHIWKYLWTPSSPYFWDAIVLLGLSILMIGLLIYAKFRSIRDRAA
ncbi:peptidase [Ornithinibacillus sp. JPR2-1]|uniref:peptidase n=1 Tax=Ornithinibacillus sp. JPR2-1 TaxID=2094019 RepID=UPI0031DCDA0F